VLHGAPPQNYSGGSSHNADAQTSGSPLFHGIPLIQPDDSWSADSALQFGLLSGISVLAPIRPTAYIPTAYILRGAPAPYFFVAWVQRLGTGPGLPNVSP
jgi:hypothetical protein